MNHMTFPVAGFAKEEPRSFGSGSSMKDKLLCEFGGTAGLKNCFIAGGAITSLFTNKPINDFDIYPKSIEAREDAIRWMFESGYYCAHSSTRAITFVKDEQQTQIMIFDTYETAEKIFDMFDFTVCMGAFDLDAEKFITHEKFLLHCSQRFLQFNPNTSFPYASAWRVRKYEERGYTIGKMEYFKILMACMLKPIQNWDELREQIGGVYGEAMDIPEDEEFTIERAFEVISTTRPCGPQGGYANANEAIACTSKREIPYYIDEREYGPNKYYAKLDEEEGWVSVSAKPLNGRLVGVEEFYPDLTFYKKVKVDDKGVYRSIFKDSFIYTLGEEVASEDPYIYCYASIEKARNHNHWGTSKHKTVLLQLSANKEDVVFDLNQPRLKRCRVMAVYPVTNESKND